VLTQDLVGGNFHLLLYTQTLWSLGKAQAFQYTVFLYPIPGNPEEHTEVSTSEKGSRYILYSQGLQKKVEAFCFATTMLIISQN
jgi:hypothetical protein